MTLWIRSQDKTILCEATDLEIFEIADDKSMEDCIIGCIRGVLGQYATKKRCVEILDEIQELLECKEPLKWFVYQMPKE